MWDVGLGVYLEQLDCFSPMPGKYDRVDNDGDE